MKKALVLLFIFAVMLPSHVFAATSTKEVNDVYFEDYANRVKEIKNAQKSISTAACENMAALTSKSKTLAAKYNSMKKSKASKSALSQAKSSMDSIKKSLNAAKKECTKSKTGVKKDSNAMLKELDKYKAEIVKEIKERMDGKSKMTWEEFQKFSSGAVGYIDTRLTYILNYVTNGGR